jgi:hypothetical protein
MMSENTKRLNAISDLVTMYSIRNIELKAYLTEIEASEQRLAELVKLAMTLRVLPEAFYQEARKALADRPQPREQKP